MHKITACLNDFTFIFNYVYVRGAHEHRCPWKSQEELDPLELELGAVIGGSGERPEEDARD